MTFALTVVRIEEALKKPGCAVCRLTHEASLNFLESLLWEGSNDPVVGKAMRASYGFCPPHTRMFAAVELSTNGTVLGINQVYARLAKWTAEDLKSYRRLGSVRLGLRKLLRKLRLRAKRPSKAQFLVPAGLCPVCELVNTSAENTLAALFEELDKGRVEIQQIYTRSKGLCLHHLRVGVAANADQFPKAANWIVADRIARLEAHQTEMLEFIRKQNWAYKEEKLTPEEENAWREVLTFFTGYPGERFNHRVEKF